MLASFISWKPCPHYGSHSYAPRSCTTKLLLSTACIHRGGHIVSSMKRRRKRKRRWRRKERRRRRQKARWKRMNRGRVFRGSDCFIGGIPIMKGWWVERGAANGKKKKKEKKWEIKSGVRGKNGCCPARQISLPPNNRAETHGRCTWKLLSGPPPPPTCPLLFDYR